jgi:hypothetical protein
MSARSPRLTGDQKREILKRRLLRQSYKTIARWVGCNPWQAKRYWLLSQPGGAERRRRIERNSKRRTRGVARRLERKRDEARQSLAFEIAAARAERATAPLYRGGPWE